MLCSRTPLNVVVLAIAVLCCAVLAYTIVGYGGSTARNVPAESVTALLLGQEDIAGKVVLSSLRLGPDKGWCYPQCANTSARIEERWNGEPIMRGGRQVSGCTAIVGFAVLESPADAVQCAREEVRGTSIAMPEVTGRDGVASFADRAWAGATSLVFTRANVVCVVFMSRAPTDKPEAIYEMGRSLSRKIDAAHAGRPDRVSILPLSSEELGVDLPDAWRLADIGEKLWGKEATTIALSDAHGIPRSIPAKKLPGDDYLVPLRHVAGVINRYNELRTSKDGNEVTLDIGQGKICFKKGESRAEGSGQTLDLGRPVESAEGEILVPISVAEKLTGKRLVWEKRDSVPIGRLEAEKAQ